MSEDEREEGKLPGVFKAPDCAQLNELLPAFRFEELIACGGMGAVYRARQLSLGRDVAIKVLPPEISAAGSVFVESFKVEARTMASLNHPNLVGIHDFGEVSGMLYLVMEYIDGNALYRSIRGRKVKQEQAVEIVEEVARGLGEAHGRGLLHRDIKPANILLTSKRKPVLGDFGLVVRSDAVGSGLNMGTPGYTAPEVVRDFEAASTSSDVYALGMILHEMLSGVMPTGEQAPDLSLVPDMNGLRGLVGRVVSSDPSQRPADGEALAEELASWLEGARRTRGLLLTPGTSGVRPSQPVARSPGAGSSPLKPVGAVEGARRTQGLLLTPEPPGTRPAQPTVLSPGVGSAPMQPAGAGRPASKGWWGLGLGALVVVLLALVGIAMVQREREPRHGGPDKVATAGEGGTAENEKGRRSPGPPGEVDQAETGGPIRDLVVRRYGKNFQNLTELRAAGSEEHPGEKVGDGLLNLVHGGKEACGLVWEGSLRVPETGLYQFTLRASSGAALVIYEEEQVVSGSGSPVSAHVLLRRGHAPLRVEYFQREGESGPVLSLHWSGPGLDGNFSLVRRSASRGGAIARNDPAPGPVEPEPAPEPKPKKPEKISQDLIAYWSFDQRKPRAGSRFTRTDLGVKEKLIRKGDPLRYHRPAADPGSRKWSSPGFDDSADWLDGKNGIGYEDEPGDFKDLLETRIETEKGKHPHSLYLRIPFEVKDPDDYKGLALFMRYDDGFQVSLNGSMVGSRNAPFPLLWNSGAEEDRTDKDAVKAETVPLGARRIEQLVPGTNVLAIHALNDGESSKPNATNTGCTSSDMLIVAELVGLRKNGKLPEEIPTSPKPASTFQIVKGSFTWHEAKADAEKRGGRLAVLNTGEKIKGVNAGLERLGTWPDMWIGLTDEKKEGDWRWITGEAVSSSAWLELEPNGDGDGAHITGSPNPFGMEPKRWNDRSQEYRESYLLELEVDKPPAPVPVAGKTPGSGALSPEERGKLRERRDAYLKERVAVDKKFFTDPNAQLLAAYDKKLQAVEKQFTASGNAAGAAAARKAREDSSRSSRNSEVPEIFSVQEILWEQTDKLALRVVRELVKLSQEHLDDLVTIRDRLAKGRRPAAVAELEKELAEVKRDPYCPAQLENFRWQVRDGKVTITKFVGKGRTAAVPRWIEDKPVIGIGKEAFKGCSTLERVLLPDGLNSLGTNAFEGCSSLMRIFIPRGITVIPKQIFKGCSKLGYIALPEGVTEIGNDAFNACHSLITIKLPSTVTALKWACFIYCRGLTHIEIPNSVTLIEHYVFSSCPNLSRVTIGKGIKSLWGGLDLSPSLKELIFLGDAPKAPANIDKCKEAIVYRQPEAKGWGSTWGGLPVRLIGEKP